MIKAIINNLHPCCYQPLWPQCQPQIFPFCLSRLLSPHHPYAGGGGGPGMLGWMYCISCQPVSELEMDIMHHWDQLKYHQKLSKFGVQIHLPLKYWYIAFDSLWCWKEMKTYFFFIKPICTVLLNSKVIDKCVILMSHVITNKEGMDLGAQIYTHARQPWVKGMEALNKSHPERNVIHTVVPLSSINIWHMKSTAFSNWDCFHHQSLW